ncbi:MAG: hypothetical protein KBG83_05925, partial [Bacteroidetes bacterium]|nr:hypothetical protein [Bacteroidota bacterium]
KHSLTDMSERRINNLYFVSTGSKNASCDFTNKIGLDLSVSNKDYLAQIIPDNAIKVEIEM